MNTQAAAFDRLLAEAEAAAAAFDGEALSTAIEALAAHVDAMCDPDGGHAQADEAALDHMRAGLIRYTRLCAFLQETLHKALLGAVESDTARYDLARNRPQPTPAPLFRRYL